jgi:hypothetical protein
MLSAAYEAVNPLASELGRFVDKQKIDTELSVGSSPETNACGQPVSNETVAGGARSMVEWHADSTQIENSA